MIGKKCLWGEGGVDGVVGKEDVIGRNFCRVRKGWTVLG